MNRITPHTTADLFFQIKWSSEGARHTDAFAGHGINFWRDLLPAGLKEKLINKQPGDRVHLNLSMHELTGTPNDENTIKIKNSQFDAGRLTMAPIEPRAGRFYPKGLLADLPGIFRANMSPFRCITRENGHLGIFLGHSLDGKNLDLDVTVGSIDSKPTERGGSSHNWGEIITQDLGMQARWKDQPTDFFSGEPFKRKDESPDIEFYEKPRLVQHLDDTAIDMVRQTYSRVLGDDMTVLDLMSSWQSHLPDDVRLNSVTGLGLNEIELHKNNDLNEYTVHDLNSDTNLPFKGNQFDVVLCNVSVEYLVSPFDIFKGVARILKPGGYFVNTFSNRWFEPKAIRIWSRLHEFERMGLILEYFRRTPLFDDLQTYSIRGLLRPTNDIYYDRYHYSDPVYAVWGRKKED